jgi:hypothetical protein
VDFHPADDLVHLFLQLDRWLVDFLDIFQHTSTSRQFVLA